MKTKLISILKKELLIIELPEDGTGYDTTILKDKIISYEVKSGNKLEINLSGYTLLGKPDEISEEDVSEFLEQSIFTSLYGHYVSGIDVNTYCYKTALDSFNSALESEIYWENPLNNKLDKSKPLIIQTEHLNKWKEAQEKTFDKSRTLIFVKN